MTGLLRRPQPCAKCSNGSAKPFESQHFPDGRIAATFDALSPVENVEHALAAVQGLAPSHPGSVRQQPAATAPAP